MVEKIRIDMEQKDFIEYILANVDKLGIDIKELYLGICEVTYKLVLDLHIDTDGLLEAFQSHLIFLYGENKFE